MRHRTVMLCAMRLSLVSLGLAGVVVFSGCGDGKVKRYAVSGNVTVDGAPAEGAIVIFCPSEAPAEVKDLRPSGVADAQGAFKLMSILPGDGAPAGEYKVIIKWPSVPPPGASDREGRGPKPGPDRLKGKYYDLDKTQLKATVEKTSNQLPPFELKTK